MPDPAVHVVVFSKDRPLQLHGYLTSLFEQWHGAIGVDVLFRRNPQHETAYAEVAHEFRQVMWFPETNFAINMLDIIKTAPAPLTCFGCDDAVFVRPVDVRPLPAFFDEEPDLLGLSLRLGATVKRGMWGQEQPHPAVLRRHGELLLWGATAPTSVGDWAYPFDVVGTVYRTEFVRRLVETIATDPVAQLDNPSNLEYHGSRRWQFHADGATHLACYHAPRLVLPTVNVVQPVFPNGTVGDDRLSPAFLLECWNAGLRLDTWRYANGPQPDSWRVGDFYLRRAV